MTDVIDTILRFKEKGYRLTRARRIILTVFKEQKNPQSPREVLGALAKKGVRVNKTTVYREIEFLLKEGILEEIQFDERTKRYELNEYHHHHIVCTACSKVEKIDSRELESALLTLEKKTLSRYHFAAVNHRLEFLGTCIACANASAKA